MVGRAIRTWLRLEMVAALALTAGLLAATAWPARAQTAADLMDRIQRLEAQVRSLNGQLEQSQFRVRQMEDQQRRMQADIEFRLNELETARGTHVPIGGVTAHALKGDRERCLEAGMDDYLPKPISPKALMAKVDRWIGIAADIDRTA